MKKLLLIAVCGLFLGATTTTFAADEDVGKDKIELTTLQEVQAQHTLYVSNGWEANYADIKEHQKGKFVLIGYKQDCLELVYCTPVVEGLTNKGFNEFLEKLKLPEPEPEKPNVYLTSKVNAGSAGGLPYTRAKRVAHV